MSMYRVLGVLKGFTHTVPEVETLQNMISKERLANMTKLVKDNVSNNVWKAGSHLATAGLCLIAGSAATGISAVTNVPIDASSWITVSSKAGEGVSTYIGSYETQTQGDLRRAEHDLNKGSDAGKRYFEFFQQYMRNVETMSQLRSRARLGQ